MSPLRICPISIHFQNPSRLDDGGFFLAVGETLGAVAIDVNSSKLFSITVINSDLPVAVLASAVGPLSA